MASYRIEDLGQPAHGDVYRTWRLGRHPQSGAPLAIGALAKGGFVIVDLAARKAWQVHAPKTLDVGWAIGQAPNGAIYQAETGKPGNKLYRWDWQSEESHEVATLPGGWSFTLDVAADGRVYLPDYLNNHLYRYEPVAHQVEDLGDFAAFGQHIRNVHCGTDGLAYMNSVTYGGQGNNRSCIVAFDPKSGEGTVVSSFGGDAAPSSRGFTQDDAGRVLVTLGEGRRHEIVHARLQAQALPALQKVPDAKLHWSNGAYLKEIAGSADVVIGDTNGNEQTISVARSDSPLRLFSIAAGGGKLWLGTIIPLMLWSYDPATRQSTPYGNPTPVDGEIYSMAFARGKLFLASYPQAVLTRFDESLPPQSRIRQLGHIKSEGLPLHRPHGRATDGNGNVFFAAHGSYGCQDSGIARIDADTEEVASWIFPDTTFGALAYCKKTDELLVSERRKGESATRFTFISPHNGRVLWSQPVLQSDGNVISWLNSGGDWIYGLHAYTATLFAFSLNEREIVAEQRELRLGEHYHNALIDGRNGRIWGATNQGIYAATRDLKNVEMLATLGEHGGQNSYCFGLAYDDNGALYFNNNTHLMRMTCEPEA